MKYKTTTGITFPRKKLLMIPGPTNVPDRINQAMIKAMVNHRGETFARVLREVTEKSRTLFQTETDPIVLTASGTGGVEAAVWNLVRTGDSVVVVTAGEFGKRLAEVIGLAGAQVIRVNSPIGTIPSFEDVEQAVRGIKRLKAVFVVHNETSGGTTIPYVEKLAQLASDVGVLFAVDAISSLGGYALPVDKWGIDICVTGSQKCLAAPPGLTLLSISRRAADYIKMNPPRIRYFDLGRHMATLEHWETPFTPAISLYYALDEALNWLIEEGLEQRVRRHTLHARTFYDALDALKLKGFAREDARSNTVIAVSYPRGIEDKEFRKTLNEEHDVVVGSGMAETKGKVFRIGSMGEVGSVHVSRTASALAVTLQKMGYPVDLSALNAALSRTSL